MAKKKEIAQFISIDRLFLDDDNPRHEAYSSQSETIEYLCNNEQVYPLARDIVRHGINPLELFALIPANPSAKSKSETSYIVAEGNRRMCAIKLLNDPELAPPKFRKDFLIIPLTYVLPIPISRV